MKWAYHNEFDPHAAKWMAQIMVNGDRKYLGRFRSEREAAQAYDYAAGELHGAFALTNSCQE